MLTQWTAEEEDHRRDAWCVELLEGTSSPSALMRARYEERTNVPAYDAADTPPPRALHEPRLLPVRCAGPACGKLFWASNDRAMYCSNVCRGRVYRAANPDKWRAYQVARKQRVGAA